MSPLIFWSSDTVSKPRETEDYSAVLAEQHVWWLLASSMLREAGALHTFTAWSSQHGNAGTQRLHGKCKAQWWPSDLDKAEANTLHHSKKLEVSQLKPFILQPTFKFWISHNDLKWNAQHHKPLSCSFWLPFSRLPQFIHAQSGFLVLLPFCASWTWLKITEDTFCN